jgi:hypothetical protein
LTNTWNTESRGKRSWTLYIYMFMHILLATQEAEIRRITDQSKSWGNSSQDPILKIPNTKKGWQSGPNGRAHD